MLYIIGMLIYNSICLYNDVCIALSLSIYIYICIYREREITYTRRTTARSPPRTWPRSLIHICASLNKAE